jgi:hypothetical protein
MMSSRLKLAVAIGTATLIATPAFAAMIQNNAPYQTYNPYTTVYRWDGKYAGQDPDGNVRFQILRDGFANEN